MARVISATSSQAHSLMSQWQKDGVLRSFSMRVSTLQSASGERYAPVVAATPQNKCLPEQQIQSVVVGPDGLRATRGPVTGA